MRKLWVKAAIVALVGGAPQAHAQVGKMAVEIDATANDPIGRQLVFYLRDAVGRSGTFAEVDSSYKTGFKVSMVTMDPNEDRAGAGQRTVYSFVILGKNSNSALETYLTHYVGICGTPRDCAQSVFGALGEEAEVLRRAVSGR